MDYDICKIKKNLKKTLDKRKYKHSINVAETAEKLAVRFDNNPKKAYLAGLIHDIARNINEEQLLAIADNNNLINHPVEYNIPIVLHANVGAFIAKTRLKIKDDDVIDAVEKHTVAAPDMSDLAKIIYLADIIEPDRKFDGLENLRKLSLKDLDKAYLQALDKSIIYIIKKGTLIHPYTIEARNNLILHKYN